MTSRKKLLVVLGGLGALCFIVAASSYAWYFNMLGLNAIRRTKMAVEKYDTGEVERLHWFYEDGGRQVRHGPDVTFLRSGRPRMVIGFLHGEERPGRFFYYYFIGRPMHAIISAGRYGDYHFTYNFIGEETGQVFRRGETPIDGVEHDICHSPNYVKWSDLVTFRHGAIVDRRKCRPDGSIPPEGGYGMPALMKMLEGADPVERWRAASVLGDMAEARAEYGGADAAVKDAVSALARALRDEDAMVRTEAAFALRHIGRDASAAVPSLLAALGDRVDHVRWAAAWALGRAASMGRTTEDAAAVRGLVEALRDDEVMVRSRAAYALGRIVRGDGTDDGEDDGTDDEKDDGERDGKVVAARVAPGPQRKAALRRLVAPLASALDDPAASVRRGAADALREIGPPAAAAIPALERLREDANDSVKRAAARALEGIRAAATQEAE